MIAPDAETTRPLRRQRGPRRFQRRSGYLNRGRRRDLCGQVHRAFHAREIDPSGRAGRPTAEPGAPPRLMAWARTFSIPRPAPVVGPLGARPLGPWTVIAFGVIVSSRQDKLRRRSSIKDGACTYTDAERRFRELRRRSMNEPWPARSTVRSPSLLVTYLLDALAAARGVVVGNPHRTASAPRREPRRGRPCGARARLELVKRTSAFPPPWLHIRCSTSRSARRELDADNRDQVRQRRALIRADVDDRSRGAAR
jgi:hypothetical protein